MVYTCIISHIFIFEALQASIYSEHQISRLIVPYFTLLIIFVTKD